MKVGIVTMYHNSLNCGGCLQAYALYKLLSKMGYSAEQIRFDIPGVPLSPKPATPVPKQGEKSAVFEFAGKVCYKLLNYSLIRKRKEVARNMYPAYEAWKKAFVGQSPEIYTADTIRSAIEHYDAFITGSDQVWNLKWYNPTWFLDFVPSERPKIAYAASVCMDTFALEERQIVQEHLRDFDFISVREESSVDLIRSVSPVEVKCTLDPTLLLDRDDWDEVASKRIVDREYVFCYFLGRDKAQKKAAQSFARKNKLKIVVMEYLGGKVEKDAGSFRDIKVKHATPSDFISLIKYAQYVFTDSFHASVFSGLYKKEFFVFPRAGEGAMSSRLYTLSQLLGFADHFCDTAEKMTPDHIDGLDRIDYTEERPFFAKMKEESLGFIKSSMNAAEVMTKR